MLQYADQYQLDKEDCLIFYGIGDKNFFIPLLKCSVIDLYTLDVTLSLRWSKKCQM